ncbi:MAG: 4'-phosphopantetheinyl transferase superfamily protein [Prevotellaceae bacterium]|nr:4'-phosphopantetheinyl transferase superfamily protein [Prevotellaceae bacterium]
MKHAVLDNLDTVTSEELEAALALLPQWRREQALRFKHEQGRKECTFSYLLLCQLLKEEYAIEEQPEFIYGEHGKPSLCFPAHSHAPVSFFHTTPSPSSIHFNLSHCRKAVACVVADSEVGIDVECFGRYKEPLARHICNDEELARIAAASSPDTEFTRLWTQKEAVVKLTGRGIDDDLKNLFIKYNNVSLTTEVFLKKGYAISVASEQPLR